MYGSTNKFRFLLFPLSLIFWGITIWRHLFYSIGFFVSKRLSVPTVSIGNITMGGTGKTPIVIAIAEFFLQIGKHPGIISRGYGRKSSGSIIVSDGKKLLTGWEEAGDEPFMIAKRLPTVPVVVDEEKYRGSKLAIEKFNVDIIILDDGFQHRAVERDLDIVLINSCDPAQYYRLLPYGRLREPVRSIMRADLIIWSRADRRVPPASIRRAVGSKKKKQLKSGLKVQESIELKDLKVLAFCGIGDPTSFINILEEKEAKILDLLIFQDHHNYTIEEIKRLKTKAKQLKADHLVTTEKDWVKLSLKDQENEFIIPIPIDVSWLENSEEVLLESLKKL